MENFYVALFSIENKTNNDLDKINFYFTKKDEFNFQEFFLSHFLENYNFVNSNIQTEFKIQEFFVIEFHTQFYCIITGEQIIVPGWSLQMKTIIENTIRQKISSHHFCDFSMKDYTYWSENSNITPRRIRSVGGALRRIILLSKKNKDTFFSTFSFHEEKNIPIKFHAVLGNKKKLQAIYSAVSQNKKIFKKFSSFSQEKFNFSCEK